MLRGGSEVPGPLRSDTVKALRLHGVGDVRVHDEPLPPEQPGTSLVEVTAVGICGSDLHWFAEGGIGDAALTRPLVLGHEFAGVVREGPLVGRRVAVDPAFPCRSCATCATGYRNLCPSMVFAGHGTCDGGLREYVRWPNGLLHQLPDGVRDADGAMLEPLGVAIHATDLGHVRLGSAAAVIGCGPIGLLLIQVLRAVGVTTVVAVEPLPARAAAALRYGADAAVGAGDAQVGVLEHTDGRGVDVAFEVAGTDEAVRVAVTAARPGARVVLLGIPDQDTTTFPAGLARRKGLTLVLVRRMNEVYPRAIGLVRRGVVDTSSLVTHRYSLADAATAFEVAAARQGLKVLVEPAR